jgi:uncharacterized protein (TIGR03083 family)
MDWIDVVEREGRALSVAARHDLQAPVPTCPGWKVTDLLAHTSGSQRSAEAILREGRQGFLSKEDLAAPSPGELDWYEAGLAALVDTMRATDPASPCWTFTGPGTAAFWFRRQAHEATVHRLDAEAATGQPSPVDPALASDGVDEALAVFLPLLVSRITSTGTVHLHATDVEGEWLLSLAPGSATVTTGHAKGDAAVRGPAEQLLRWTWGRPHEGLEVFGDTELVSHLQAALRV